MRVTKTTTIAHRGGTSLPFFAFLLLAAALALGACNTMSGVGEDVSAAGRGLDQTSERTQSKMSGSTEQQQRDSDYQAGRY